MVCQINRNSWKVPVTVRFHNFLINISFFIFCIHPRILFSVAHFRDCIGRRSTRGIGTNPWRYPCSHCPGRMPTVGAICTFAHSHSRPRNDSYVPSWKINVGIKYRFTLSIQSVLTCKPLGGSPVRNVAYWQSPESFPPNSKPNMESRSPPSIHKHPHWKRKNTEMPLETNLYQCTLSLSHPPSSIFCICRPWI